MSNYVISCCSTADLTKEHFEKRNISYICFHYELNGKEYADDLGQSMPFDVFYKAMQDGASTKTSQVNADEFEEYFEGFLKQGKDVLHVCLSSGISGVINSANVAKAELEEKYTQMSALYGMTPEQLKQNLPIERLTHDLRLARARAIVVDSGKEI